ncbi:MAG: hypothetical protein EHM49_00715, partial [Deltaproteobacteria bacterium]
MAGKWNKLITFNSGTLNSFLNGAEIADNELQTAEGVIFDRGVLEKAPGRTAIGTAHVSGAKVDGVFRSYDKAGNKVLLRVVNGAIQRWTGAAWEDVETGLTAGVPYDFINSQDKTLIVNGYDDAREFDPSTNTIQKLGLEPPRFYKKAAYFESDETSLFTLGTNGSFNTVNYRIEERTGTSKQSLKLTAGAGETKSSYLTYASAQDFSLFPNGLVISNDAFFCVHILHRERDYVDAIYIDFETSAGNYYRFTIDGTDLDQVYARDNVWTPIQLKKSVAVATGSPDWASIAKVTFSLVGQTGTAEVYFDNCYWKNPPIEAVRYKKAIDSFEGLVSDYTVTNASLSSNLNLNYIKEGTKSLKVVIVGAQTVTLYRTVSVNLAQYIDGITSQESDVISLQVKGATPNLTSLTKRLYSDVGGGKYFWKQYTVAGGDFKKSTTGAWSELSTAKSDFTDNGTADWTAIVREYIQIVTTGSVVLYLDDFCLEEAGLQLILSTMETDEVWTYGTAGSGGFNTNKNRLSAGDTSIYLKIPRSREYTAYRSLGASANLNQFGGGEASGEDDFICFWLSWTYFQYIRTIKLRIDVNTGDFATDYYEYELTQTQIANLINMSGRAASLLSNKSVTVEIAKADFTRVGVTAGKDWSTTIGYEFLVATTASAWLNLTVYFDNLHLRRATGLTGIYQWCCLFRSSDGNASGISEWSQELTLKGTKALLGNLPLSADPNCAYREFYRRGGNLGAEARLDFTIYDNTTTQYFTDLSD